jgi:hypothetical protein
MTLITGNTYPVRAELKALGATWSKDQQGWLVPDDRAEAARAIVAAAPAESRAPRQSRYSRGRNPHRGVTRFASGATVYRNPRGRCEDAPCCGCCS